MAVYRSCFLYAAVATARLGQVIHAGSERSGVEEDPYDGHAIFQRYKTEARKTARAFTDFSFIFSVTNIVGTVC